MDPETLNPTHEYYTPATQSEPMLRSDYFACAAYVVYGDHKTWPSSSTWMVPGTADTRVI